MIIKKAFSIVFLVLIGSFISYWLISIIKCEYLTSKHGEEFFRLELQTNLLDQAEILKVLYYSEVTATVYFKSNLGGNILEFRKNNNIWVLNRWISTVWSKQGSADGFMWPYIR
jgi:hypothetical protein